MTKSKSSSSSSEQKIKAAYISHVLENQDHPSDMFSFCSNAKIDEQSFLAVYDDLEEVHSEIWSEGMLTTLQTLAEDPQFGSFNSREQLLAFYYTHVEILKEHRNFYLVDRKRMRVPIPLPRFLLGYKMHFMDFAEKLVDYGMKTEEIADRKFLNKQYLRALWTQLYWLIQFWMNDDSNEFESTDAAIEKAVNLSFELARPGPIDSMIDFAKFIYQNR